MVEVLEADDRGIRRSVEILREGGVVAFPTETVYGLGCDATNEKAIRRVYEVKKRPTTKPFIVGIWDRNYVEKIAEVNELARRFMEMFFPGPLTLVLRSKGVLPSILSPDGKIAVRMPSHPIPLTLMEKLGKPIIVPSANISGRPSPMKFQHVIDEFGSEIDAVIKGDCRVGIESTIVDVTVDPPEVLRLGAIGVRELEKVTEVKIRRSAGGYDISCPVYVFVGGGARREMLRFAEEVRRKGLRVAVLSRKGGEGEIRLGETVEEYASNLFAAIREAESSGVDLIVLEGIEEHEGVMDRLVRIAGERIFRV